MKRLLWCLLFLNVLFALIANPAPQSLEPIDLVMIALTCLIAVLCLLVSPGARIHPPESRLLTAVILYMAGLFLSALGGVVHGVSLLGVLRSVGSYVAFFPLLFVGFLPANRLQPTVIAIMLIVVGLLQTGYLGWLYFSQGSAIGTTLGVLRHRITFMDQRTTLPLLLSVPILPLLFMEGRRLPSQMMLVGLVLIGFFAGIVTLTRAIFLSMIVGWLVYACVWFYQKIHLKEYSFISFFKKLRWILPLMILAIYAVSLLPRVHLLEMGLLARFSDHTANGHVDYSNGRIHDEWIPALQAWYHAGPLAWLFGIGAGSTFIVLSGEERTYIHNLTLYTLVYGGIYGLCSCFWLYITLFRTLLWRTLQTQQAVYPAFFALLASLYFYGQLFAVHKGLAYNEILFLIVAAALLSPFGKIKPVPGKQ